jgi:hypothetical protein
LASAWLEKIARQTLWLTGISAGRDNATPISIGPLRSRYEADRKDAEAQQENRSKQPTGLINTVVHLRFPRAMLSIRVTIIAT